MRNWGQWLTIGLGMAAAACGSDSAPPAPFSDAGGTRPPYTGVKDAGPDADAALQAEGAPLVTVMSPLDAPDPTSENVLVEGSVAVQCAVEKAADGDEINPESVQIKLYVDEEVEPRLSVKATSTSTEGVYENTLPLSEIPTGVIHVECSAEDASEDKRAGRAFANTFVDHGPTISFLHPSQGNFVAAGDGDGEDVRVRVQVEASPLADSDPGAEVAEVRAWVGGLEIAEVAPSATEDNVYTFGVDFNDKALFKSGIPETFDVRISATNQRSPSAATAIAELSVGVDQSGPTISLISPALRRNSQDPIVSGKVDVVVEVVDDLGQVVPGSVVLEINGPGGLESYTTTSRGNDIYETSFQTASYEGMSKLELNIKAKDSAGYLSTLSQSIYIDTVPPWISLDPLPVREAISITTPGPSGNDWRCSGDFDPLGDEAINDRQITQSRQFLPRAIVWDRAIEVGALSQEVGSIDYYAMINGSDDQAVQLYVQQDTAIPLIIDTDGDGLCDAINTEPADATKAPVLIKLEPITPAGTAPRSISGNPVVTDFTDDPLVTIDGSAGYFRCDPDNTTNPPAELCEATTLTRALKHTVVTSSASPVIYAPKPEKEVACVGSKYESPKTGWICLAVRANDAVGNEGLSEPIRVCVYDSNDPSKCPGNPGDVLASDAELPAGLSCTDTCTMPDHFLREPTGKIRGMPRVVRK